ncbi:MAG: response regulator [Pseudomonas sp.]
MIRIQIVDDEPNVLNSLRRVLRSDQWQLECCSNPHEALEALQHDEYAVIISDYQMPGLDGVTYLRFARQRQPDAVRMVLTGQHDREAMLRAINQAEIHRFLLKPWDDYELRTAVQSAAALYGVRQENRRLLEQVRRQQQSLDAQAQELARLEREHPGLVHVLRDEDGAVLIDDEQDRDAE